MGLPCLFSLLATLKIKFCNSLTVPPESSLTALSIGCCLGLAPVALDISACDSLTTFSVSLPSFVILNISACDLLTAPPPRRSLP